jgi:hypothetical protein
MYSLCINYLFSFYFFMVLCTTQNKTSGYQPNMAACHNILNPSLFQVAIVSLALLFSLPSFGNKIELDFQETFVSFEGDYLGGSEIPMRTSDENEIYLPGRDAYDLSKPESFVSEDRHIIRGNENFDAVNASPTISSAESLDLTFRVQLIATKEKLNPDEIFKALNDVGIYYHNGLYKYTCGKVDNLDDARSVKKDAEDKGFAGTFIAAFYKGERIIIDDKPDPYATNTGLVFRVQILSSAEPMPLNHSLFKGLGSIRGYEQDGTYLYTWGGALMLEEAEKLKEKLKKVGFSEAIVLPFYKI